MLQRLLRSFSLRAHSVSQASTLLAVTALVSNLLGLMRNLIFYRLITPGTLDVYYASFRVSDFIFNVLIAGAITSSLIPTLSELLGQKKEQEAKELTNQLLSWGSLALLVLLGLLYLGMDPLMHVIVRSFDPERLQQSILLSRIMLLQAIFFSWSFIIGSLLNGYRRFLTFAIAPLVYNVSLIAGGVLAPRYGLIGLVSLVIVGSLAHFLIQYWEARKIGFRFRFSFHSSERMQHVFQLMLPRSLAQAFSQLVLVVYTMLASGLTKGSLAIFSGINDLQTTPTVIVGNSLATASFPALSSYVAENQQTQTNQLLLKVIRAILFLILPISALALVLRAQVVRLYFGIGGASWTLTDMAIHTFTWFMIGLIPAALLAVLLRLFYAHKDTRTPMQVSVGAAVISIAVAWIGISQFNGDVATLAISEVIGSFAQLLAYWWIASTRRYFSLSLKDLWPALRRYLIGSILTALATWATLHTIDWLYQFSNLSTERVSGLLLQGILAALVGALVYFSYSNRNSREELQWVTSRSFTSKS